MKNSNTIKSILAATGIPDAEIALRMSLAEELPREFLENNACLIFSGKDEVCDIACALREVALGISRRLHVKKDFLGTPILSPGSLARLASIEKKNTKELQKHWEAHQRG